MKATRMMWALAACVGASVAFHGIALGDEPTTMPREKIKSEAMKEMGGEGALEAMAMTMTFTVQDVDSTTRMVTLKGADGAIEKFKAGPEVRNFDQIKKGDMVKATVVDEIAVSIRKGGAPMVGEKQMIAVAPKGAKPGVVMLQTDQMSAKIQAIDTEKRMVSLEGPMGKTRTIKVSPKVDLSQLQKGDDVTVQVAQGMAIMVESPTASDMP